MLKELSKNDAKWRQIASMITKGNKFEADDLVNEMYLRRYDNNRGQPVTEYYILLTMKSIYLNQKKTNKLIVCEDLRTDTLHDDKYEINDYDKEILERYTNLNYTERELLELTYDHSLRDIQKEFGINYGYAHKIINEARKKVLKDRIDEYQNKRLKHRKMKSKGFGDTVEKILKVTGVKKLVELMNVDCGCDERKEYLNKVFSYKLEPRCMTLEEINEYSDFVRARKFKIGAENKAIGTISNDNIDYLVSFYNSIFATSYTVPECRGCSGSAKLMIDMVVKLDTVYLNNLPSEDKKKVEIVDVNNLDK